MKLVIFKSMINICQHIMVIFLVSAFVSSNVMAVNIPIKLSGIVHVPPCVVNNGENINIFFGDISVSDVSNERNIRKMTIPVTCEYSQGTAYVKVTGPKLGSNINVLATNVAHFGIALFQGDGTAIKLVLGEGKASGTGTIGYPVTSGISGQGKGTFTFTAVPFKDGSFDLNAGEFTASANMQITYL